MKKTLAILASTVLIFSMFGAPAYAHGHHGGGRRSSSYGNSSSRNSNNSNYGRSSQAQPRYDICTVDGCKELGQHQHDNTWYCSNRDACTAAGCTLSGPHHAHDGTGHHSGTGRGYCWTR